MRRMITEKQQEAIKTIEVGADAININGDGILQLNSMSEDPYAQIAISDAPVIELNIYSEDAGELETKIGVYEEAVRLSGVDLYAGTIENAIVLTNDNDDFHLNIPKVSYITAGGNIKKYGGEGNAILFYGKHRITAEEMTSLNTLKPTSMMIDSVNIGENEDVYGFRNTKILLGSNVYLWDSGEERYVLQGTYQLIGHPDLELVPIVMNSIIKCYNS